MVLVKGKRNPRLDLDIPILRKIRSTGVGIDGEHTRPDAREFGGRGG